MPNDLEDFAAYLNAIPEKPFEIDATTKFTTNMQGKSGFSAY